MKAIVVDDSKLIRRVIAAFLAMQRFETVLEATNGVDALRQLAGEQVPDLAVLDVNMPVMSGAQLVGVLRGQRRFASMKIVLVTAEADRTRMPGLERADACVTKPFTAAKLHGALAALGFAVSPPAPEAMAV
jgi:two-component system chemotaxis response regulator CheY